jgi:hypothetical protein
MQASGSVINPSRFQSSYTPAIGGNHNKSNIPYYSSIIDITRDSDFQFLKVIKECLIHMDRSALVQCLPSTPLTDYHLYWLVNLASVREESHHIVKHIVNTYKVEADLCLKTYYKTKLARIMKEDIEEDIEENKEMEETE